MILSYYLFNEYKNEQWVHGFAYVDNQNLINDFRCQYLY